MDDITEQFARRDRFRRKMQWLKTPSQRMADMARLQQNSWRVLKNSPAGYARFLRRNFKARAIEVRDLHAS
jgi:phenylacetate-coenzyme A ligase PaaK-like adenylate-forming protein